MKICLIVAARSFLGGHLVQANEIIENFAREGIELNTIPIDPQLKGFLGACQRYKYIRTIVTEAAYIKSLLREIPKYDILHVYSASYWSFLLAPTPAILIGRYFKKKIILNYHSGEAGDHLRRWGFIVKRILKYADIIVVPSLYLQRIFRKYGIETRVIYNVVDEKKFPFKRKEIFRPNFIITRLFQPLYNVACVLKALRLIQDEYPYAQLTVIGYGIQERFLKSLACRLNLKNVIFTGRVEHASIVKYYEDNDIMLNASNIDNMPISILEAFSCGIPVISTRAGGIPDIITDGKTGILVPLNDEKSIAKKAIEILQNQEFAQNIVRNALDHFKSHYSWEANRQKWLDVYGI